MPELVCIDCDRTHDPTTSRCPCGGALDHGEPLHAVHQADLSREGRGLARFEHLLGLPESAFATLGEGDTPLLELPGAGCRVKVESANPTGSFKDRGAAVVVAHAAALGAERVVEDSSGNAGSAVAAYAARHGLGCTVFSPEHVTPAKRARMETLGAEVRIVEGDRSGVTEAAVAEADEPGAYYASHTYPPYFLDGCATIAYELVDELGRAPDVLVTPCAMGSILLGTYRGFQRLEAGGVIEGIPRLVAVQATGYDPVARALGRGGDSKGEADVEAGREGEREVEAHAEGEPPNTFADGLLVPEPPRLEQMVDAIEATGGSVTVVAEAATRVAMERLHHRGVLVEPSSATALAGYEQLVEAGEIGTDEDAVLVLTGRWSPG